MMRFSNHPVQLINEMFNYSNHLLYHPFEHLIHRIFCAILIAIPCIQAQTHLKPFFIISLNQLPNAACVWHAVKTQPTKFDPNALVHFVS